MASAAVGIPLEALVAIVDSARASLKAADANLAAVQQLLTEAQTAPRANAQACQQCGAEKVIDTSTYGLKRFMCGACGHEWKEQANGDPKGQ